MLHVLTAPLLQLYCRLNVSPYTTLFLLVTLFIEELPRMSWQEYRQPGLRCTCDIYVLLYP